MRIRDLAAAPVLYRDRRRHVLRNHQRVYCLYRP